MALRSRHRNLTRRENVVVTPNVEVLVREGDGGRVLDRIQAHNLVTTEGLYKLIRLIAYPDSNLPAWDKSIQYIAVGTDSTAPAAGNTVLGNEILRKLVTRRYPQTLGIDFYLDVGTTEGNGNSFCEIGMFSEVTGGILWARCTHAAISKTASVSVQYRWNWTFGVP